MSVGILCRSYVYTLNIFYNKIFDSKIRSTNGKLLIILYQYVISTVSFFVVLYMCYITETMNKVQCRFHSKRMIEWVKIHVYGLPAYLTIDNYLILYQFFQYNNLQCILK